MSPLIRLLALALLVPSLAACTTEEPEPTTPLADEAPAPEPATPQIVDGVQVVNVTVGPLGYEPGEIALQAGMPARLVFTRTIEGDCPSQVQIPALGVEATDLPMHEPVAVEFTPDEGGTFAFVCGMDMMRGSLLVQS